MSGVAGGPSASVLKQRTFLGHPVGLYVLFLTEMWERFSYYGMRALLVLYMVNYFKWAQKDASGIYKWYTSLVYLTPLLGGYLADRYLGNKRAVLIGAVLMAVGHFLMAFETREIFIAALVFLILGNGFFKPNMSTQVGRLYPRNDPRRDGAYTIFYMGINLGAFLSPLLCGWLANNTEGGFHTGFTMAGIGMVFGLLIYVVGMNWVVELDQTGAVKLTDADQTAGTGGRPIAVALPEASEAVTKAPPRTEAITNTQPTPTDAPMSEVQAEKTPSVLPWVTESSAWVLMIIGAMLVLGSLVWAGIVMIPWLMQVANGEPHPTFLALAVTNNTVIGLGIVAVCTLIAAWILFSVKNAERDRVLAIYALGIFVVFFWAAFEQAGNALNLWADTTTNRYLTRAAPDLSVYPEPARLTEETATGDARPASGFMGWLTMWKLKPSKAASDFWNPVSTESFQSINALAIFVLAPLFAVLWVWLARRGIDPSTPTKMAIGVLLMSSAFGLMIFAGRWEDQPTRAPLPDGLPQKIEVNDKNQLISREEERPFQGGRLTYDPATKTLLIRGVMADTERDLLARETAPDDYVKAVIELKRISQDAQTDAQGHFSVSVHLDPVPPGFDLKYAGFNTHEVSWDADAQTLTVRDKKLADKDVKVLLVAGADQSFRNAADTLYLQSAHYQVSSWWLFWFYILSTLGELCLSPVGLSMVSKLAPARFATMLMGLWLLTSFFGNFAAGQFGEGWSAMAPIDYFFIIMTVLATAALVLFVLVGVIKRMMHGVK